MFETRSPRKVLLHIELEYITRIQGIQKKFKKEIQNRILDLKSLEEALNEIIRLPPDGKLHHFTNIDGIIVLIWDFESITRCSSASRQHFTFVGIDENLFKFSSEHPKGKVSLPFLYSMLRKMMFSMIKKIKL